VADRVANKVSAGYITANAETSTVIGAVQRVSACSRNCLPCRWTGPATSFLELLAATCSQQQPTNKRGVLRKAGSGFPATACCCFCCWPARDVRHLTTRLLTQSKQPAGRLCALQLCRACLPLLAGSEKLCQLDFKASIAARHQRF
jgi:hypothetical protein